MKKSIFSALLVSILLLSACGQSDQPTQSNSSQDPVPSEAAESSVPTPEIPVSDDSLGNGIYKTGDFIKAGKYIVTCTEADYALKIVVFETTDAYDQYNNAERVTNGEELAAIEQYALRDLYLKPEEKGFISLPEGSVLLLDEGRGLLEDFTSDTFYSGAYFVGDDLEEGQYEFTCTEAEYGVSFIVFDTMQNYLDYHKTSRFTVGEENTAVEQFASTNEYLQEGDNYSVFLSNDSVVLLKDGAGTLIKQG